MHRSTLVICLSFLLAPLLHAQSFEGIGVPSGSEGSVARGVSADGSVVVGYSTFPYTFSTGESVYREAFRWENGVQSRLGFPPGAPPGDGYREHSSAFAISADGSAIVGLGHSIAAQHGAELSHDAIRWEDGAWTRLPNEGGDNVISSALEVSADGSVIVGFSGGEVDYGSDATRWLNGARQVLTTDGVAYAVSGDGTVTVGIHGPNFSTQTAFKWTPGGGLVDLGTLGRGYTRSEALGVSDDGSVIVGSSSNAAGTVPVRWTASGVELLAGGDGRAIDVSADGLIVVGNSNAGIFIWSQADGRRSLQTILTDAGVDLSGWNLGEATAISDDGTTIVGQGTNPQGKPEGWRASLVLDDAIIVNSTADRADDDLDDEVCDTGETVERDGEEEAECTLRAALQTASKVTGSDRTEIRFDIPEGGVDNVYTIALEGDLLPVVTSAIYLNGDTQPGGGLIQIDGNGLDGDESSIGFDLGNSSSSAFVEGLAFYGFPGTVLALRGDDSYVAGSVFGSDWARSYTRASTDVDAFRNGGDAILVTGDGVSIGFDTADQGNLIVGSRNGIVTDPEGIATIDILGNEIGVLEMPNTEDGIHLTNAAGITIGTSEYSNHIAHNLGYGIRIDGELTAPATIQSNGIVENGLDGISYTQSASPALLALIGGSAAGEGNLIQKNGENGIHVVGDSDATPSATARLSIEGNTIRGNAELGIRVMNGSRVRIGGETGEPGAAPGNEIEDGIAFESGFASWIQGNRIALLDPETGKSAVGNVVFLRGTGNTIGGELEGEGNIIYGAASAVVDAENIGIFDEATQTLIQNNFIGNDGESSLPLGTGLYLNSGSSQVLNNVISGNAAAGLVLARDAVVEGNLIGTNITGLSAIPNVGAGIEVTGGSPTIGGLREEESCERPCNVISGNIGPGILIRADAAGTKIQGNLIGLGSDGLTPVGNGEGGIVALADNVVIGGENDVEVGSCLGACNVIAANSGDGIRNFHAEELVEINPADPSNLMGTGEEGANGVVIQGNFIGSPTVGGGNSGHGIALGAGGEDNMVGGGGVDVANLITGNGGAGVVVHASSDSPLFDDYWIGGEGNTIRRNLIYGNGAIPIDLHPNYILPGGDGWSPLDEDDEDEGPNAMLNWPYLASSTVNDNETEMLVLWTGDRGASRSTYTLDFYTSETCRGGTMDAMHVLSTGATSLFPLDEETDFDTLRVSLPYLESRPYYAATFTEVSTGNTSEMGNCRKAGMTSLTSVGQLDAGVQTLVDGLLLTLASAGKSGGAASQSVLISRFDEAMGGDLFEETAALNSDGAPIVPRSVIGPYWEVIPSTGPENLQFNACLDASALQGEPALVLGRGTNTDGIWRPYDTVLETVDGTAYACAYGLSAMHLALGSGEEAALATPSLLSPMDGATGVSPDTSLTWAALAGAVEYDLQVALDVAFSVLVVDETGLSGTTATPETLVGGAWHFWRVRGRTEAGVAGPWSVAYSFRTPGAVSIDDPQELARGFGLTSVYPNPFAGSATVVFETPTAAAVHLAVYDVLGRQVGTLFDGHVAPGRYEAQFEAQDLSGGIYLVRMRAGGFTATRTVTLVR